jgi:hypothetical protein
VPLIKRLTLSRLREIDDTLSTSYVREIEMLVDSICQPTIPQYPIQFWRDVELYGLQEALLYLSNYVKDIVRGVPKHPMQVEFNELKALCEKIQHLSQT